MQLDSEVMIVGAGPVGLTLALDLAQRGVSVTVVELRSAGEPPSAKCNTVSARTMEIFRRLGVADAVRDAGLTPDFPTDVIYATRLTGHELCRIVQPSRRGRFAADGRSAPGYPDSAWATPEPVHRVSQLQLEPVLFAAAEQQPNIRLINDTEALVFEDHDAHVELTCRSIRAHEPFCLRARYLVGCDGARSSVRKQMGVALEGDAEIGRTRSTLIRSKAVLGLFPDQPAWMTWVVNADSGGTVVAIDGEELWLVHRSVPASAPDFDALDFDQSIRAVLGVGDDFKYETIHHEDWTGRRLVASQFRKGSVFIAGDAAHLWVPFAGYGMNAGIADATNLAWMLAAVFAGWAPDTLLDAHEAERHPVTEQVSRFAMNLVMQNTAQQNKRGLPTALESDTQDGTDQRTEFGAALKALNLQQFACAGLNFGYFYDNSPVIAYDGEPAPRYTMGSVTASTVPGCRLPHFWLEDGRSLYDCLGPAFTLLQFDASLRVAPIVAAAKERAVPLEVLDLSGESAAQTDSAFCHALVLARSDQHIAWRGNTPPASPGQLIDLVRGAGGDATA